jgi:hypothetical protein
VEGSPDDRLHRVRQLPGRHAPARPVHECDQREGEPPKSSRCVSMKAFGPARQPVAGDGLHLGNGRSSSARAEYAFANVSRTLGAPSARPSSGSRWACAVPGARSSVVRPWRSPASRAACRHQPRGVSLRADGCRRDRVAGRVVARVVRPPLSCPSVRPGRAAARPSCTSSRCWPGSPALRSRRRRNADELSLPGTVAETTTNAAGQLLAIPVLDGGFQITDRQPGSVLGPFARDRGTTAGTGRGLRPARSAPSLSAGNASARPGGARLR